MTSLECSLKKLCDHKMCDSFCAQFGRLAKAGYPHSVIVALAASLLQKLKGTRKAATADSAQHVTQPKVLPHAYPHSQKKVTWKHGVLIVLSAPKKLSMLCSRISGENTVTCNKRHVKPYSKCTIGAVYKISLSCGKVYIGCSVIIITHHHFPATAPRLLCSSCRARGASQ